MLIRKKKFSKSLNIWKETPRCAFDGLFYSSGENKKSVLLLSCVEERDGVL